MAVYARVNKRDKFKSKVAQIDASTMLTLKDILFDPALAKQFLKKKEDAPAGCLRTLYNTKDNPGLMRKIFSECLKIILYEVAIGQCKFMLTVPGRHKPFINITYMEDKLVKVKRQNEQLQEFDLHATNFKIPYLTYNFSETSSKKPIRIYVNKKIYKSLYTYANTGKSFSSRPRYIDYFLPYIYEKFSYIEEDGLMRLIRHGFHQLQKNLMYGEEIRFIDKDGEIRFFRPLGKYRSKVTRQVVKSRLTRERNKLYESFNK